MNVIDLIVQLYTHIKYVNAFHRHTLPEIRVKNSPHINIMTSRYIRRHPTLSCPERRNISAQCQIPQQDFESIGLYFMLYYDQSTIVYNY